MVFALCAIMNLASITACGKAILGPQKRPIVGNLRNLTSVSALYSSRLSSRCSKVMGSLSDDLDHFVPLTRTKKPTTGRWGGVRSVNIMATQATATNSKQSLFFADAGIHRATELRADSTWLANAFSRADTLVIPMLGAKNMVHSCKAVYISPLSLPGIKYHDAVFLGVSETEKIPIFTVNVEDLPSVDEIKRVLDDGAEWVDVRKYGPRLNEFEAGLLAYARGMIEWHIRHRHCGRCGSKTVLSEAGHSMTCTNSEKCGKLSYPRMDPAVIMLITCGNYLLLGRQERWDLGRYSLLAGFVEIGETFEMAVAREVKEEAGVDVDIDSVRYEASQPWPFPASLMIGFIGAAVKNKSEPYNGLQAHGQAIPVGLETVPEVNEVNSLPRPSVDTKELEDARWVHRSFLKSVLRGEALPHNQIFNVPGNYAIANRVMQRWVEAESARDVQWAGSEVPTVDIDEGIFKYILVKIEDDEGHQRLLVRGSKSHAYHSDILEDTKKRLSGEGLVLQVSQLGGGRIEHDSQNRTLRVYSSSQAYGQADHTVTCAHLRQAHPLHEFSISWDP
ncbi:hypothetical protein R1sor_003108 [Riccia sorocarpa]|uniref:NAD(+) diphosphatase n=1 Tax=Riccia sorocarpa TaxID=122646 RepID=A0ABD3H2B8_9MARC